MKYTEEIFNILSKGGFISSNSVSTQVKRLYDAIEEDLPDYYDYYKGIGFYLEGGDGYYYFTRKESKVDLERKLEAIQKWIDYLSFLKTYHSAFGPGFLFRAADIEIQIGCDIELKEKATKLFSDKKKYDEVVGKLLKELESIGLIDVDYYKEGGIYKYTYGASADYNKVLRTKRTITAQFKDAFIIAFRNGEKMNVNEAIAEFKKRRNK